MARRPTARRRPRPRPQAGRSPEGERSCRPRRRPNPGPVAPVVPTATPAQEEAARAVPDALGHKLQSRLNKLRSKYAIPGVSVTIILADGSTWTGTSGYANVRKKTRVKDDTAFALASVSKTYTSALIMALANEGKLDLDARVSTILPKVRIAGKATVRQLLDHTSGLPDYFLNGKIDRALFGDRAREWTTQDSFRYVGKPIFPAGKGWYYSNTNYALLALVAEAVDDRPLSEQLRSRFLDPLGLDHTYEQIDERPEGPIARGYRVTGSAEQARLLRPVRRQQGHALHLGRDRGSGRRFDGGLVVRCRALGAGPVRRRGPAPGDGPRDGRRRAQHGPLPAADRLRAGRPGDDARRPPGARSFGAAHRLPVARPPPARRRDHDRGAHERGEPTTRRSSPRSLLRIVSPREPAPSPSGADRRSGRTRPTRSATNTEASVR